MATHYQTIANEQHQTNLLKFLKLSRQRKNNIEKLCYPEQTYGVSRESPTHFRNSFTLVSPTGYLYQQRFPGKDYQLLHAESVGNAGQIQKDADFSRQFQNTFRDSPLVFHRKKGLLSDFKDKNINMKGYVFTKPIDARPHAPKIHHHESIHHDKPKSAYLQTIPVLMGQKLRIRKKRNRLQSDSQQRDRKVVERGATKFQTLSFGKRELSEEMDKRAQTSRQNAPERRLSLFNATARTVFGRTTAYTKYTDMKSTRAATTRLANRLEDMEMEGYTDDYDNQSNTSEIIKDKFYRTQKLIPFRKE